MSEKITITGNIATVPERRVVAGGLVVTSFRVASGERRQDRETGQWSDGDTSFYKVSAYRALAENCYDSFHLGERVIVTGRLRIKDWDTGAKKGTTAEIDVDGLGHDLLWGTSKFRKNERELSAAEAEAEDDADADPQAEAATAWDTTDIHVPELVAANTPY